MSQRKTKKKTGWFFFFLAMLAIILVTIVSNYTSGLIMELEPPEGRVVKLFTSGNELVAVSDQNKVYLCI